MAVVDEAGATENLKFISTPSETMETASKLYGEGAVTGSYTSPITRETSAKQKNLHKAINLIIIEGVKCGHYNKGQCLEIR